MGEVLDQVESAAQDVAMEIESDAAVPFDETATDSTPQVRNSKSDTLSLTLSASAN